MPGKSARATMQPACTSSRLSPSRATPRHRILRERNRAKSRLLQIAVTHHRSFRLRRRLSTQMSALRPAVRGALRPAVRGDAPSGSSASSACPSAYATRSFQGPSSPMPTARRAARPPINAREREGSARDPLQFVAMRGPFFGFGRAGGTGLPAPVGGIGGTKGGAEPLSRRFSFRPGFP